MYNTEEQQMIWDAEMELRPGDKCLYCGQDILEYSEPDEPWNGEHLVCPTCYSDYGFWKDFDVMFVYNPS